MERAVRIFSNEPVTPRDVFLVARERFRVSVSAVSRAQVLRSRDELQELMQTTTIYGIHTGYGERVYQLTPAKDEKEKQRRLIESLHCGSGDLLRPDQVRAALFARFAVLAQGYSGVRAEILDEMVRMLNEQEIPEIPSIGSIGASGDLVPSSYFARCIAKKIPLEGREGLALVNGTSCMTGVASLVVEDFDYLYQLNSAFIAVLFECLHGIGDVFDADLHEVKKHREQWKVAKDFRAALFESRLVRAFADVMREVGDETIARRPIQDRYSLRCLVPQLGAIEHRLCDVRRVVTDELNSVSDNPVIVRGAIKHGGHFDGSYIADAMDCFKLSIRKLAYILRAYVRNATDAKLNHGLAPTYLVMQNPELNNGLQGLAGLAFDAVYIALEKDAIPDSLFSLNDHEGANQDVVSLGMHAAVSASRMIDRLRTLTAMVAIVVRQMVAVSGVEGELSPAAKNLYAKLAGRIPVVEDDRSLHDDLRRIEDVLYFHEW